MKTYVRVLNAFFAVVISISAHAQYTGDTIRVFSHHEELIVTDPSKGWNEYINWAEFPDEDTPIRRITMYVHFSCPKDTMRCADWDYSDRILLRRAGGSSGKDLNWELGRIITPYGGFYGDDWGFTWQADLTDFSMVLRDSCEISFIHSGYEPNHDRGWIISLEFEIITGKPVAFPVSITEIYNDHFEYGNDENPIEKTLLPVAFTGDKRADFARLRVIQTGHGMDRPDNCAEFCDKYREFFYDGRLFSKKQMWMKCGYNPVFPQAGTWIFDRANWCPGYLMQAETFELPVTKEEIHTVHFIMEPYTATTLNHGTQVISAYLIQYENPVSENDVSVEDIIVPSDKNIYSLKNPAAANPLIIIRNNGSKNLNSLNIEYGTKGFPSKNYLWTGNLGFNQIDTIRLPGLIDAKPGINHFEVQLHEPNGKADDYPEDNRILSVFKRAAVHQSPLVFKLLTNNQPEHNSWQLYDSEGKYIEVRELGSMAPATIYIDTFHLVEGAYSLVFTDTMGDGLEFWFNAEGGRGEAHLFDGRGNLIKAFEPDCGSGWTYNFSIGDDPDLVDHKNTSVSIYPARTSEATTLRYFSNTPDDVLVRLISDPGNNMLEERHYPNLREGVFDFDLRRFPYGRFYVIVFKGENEIFKKRIRYTEPQAVQHEPPYKLPEDPEVRKKLDQWQDWKFGVIIHWGPYSQWDVVESWSLCPEDETWCVRTGPYADNYGKYVEEYRKIRTGWNPDRFDPDKWAKACRDAGMKYLVFTTKHHDGYCMYDSRYTDYSITDVESAFSQNPRSNISMEVFDAFRARGIAAGVYFSKPDWNSHDYWWPYFPVFDRNVNYDPEKYPERWQRFRDFTYNQLEELMTDYGDVDILWLDGGWVRPAGTLTDETRPWLGKNQWIQDIDMPRIAKMAREKQPGILIVDRTVHGDFENYRTPEQQIPQVKPDHPWESCITLGSSWYAVPDEHYKSTHWIIHTLIRIVTKGGNLLLGIGPDKTGDLVPEVYKRLEETGKWMDVNSEAIYNTRPVEPYTSGKFCFTQSKDEQTKYLLYLLEETEEIPAIITLPDDFPSTAKSIRLLGHDKTLRVKHRDGKYSVNIPGTYRKNNEDAPAIVFSLMN